MGVPTRARRTDGASAVVFSVLGRVGSRIISSLGLGVVIVLVARAAGPAEFGVFMAAFAVGSVGGLVCGFGAPVRVLRIAGQDRHLAGQLYVMYVLAILLAGALAVAVCGFAGLGMPVIAGLVFAIGDAVQGYAQAHFTGLDRQGIANLLVVTHRMPPLFAVIVIQMDRWTEHSWAVMVVAFLVSGVVGVLVPIRAAAGVDPAGALSCVSGGLDYWGYSLSAVTTQLQLPLLGLVASPEVTGWFALATRVVGPIALVPTSAAAIAVPELVRRQGSIAARERLTRQLYGACGGYAILVCLGAVPLAYLLLHFTGPEYDAALPILIGAIVGAAVSSFSQGFNARLLADGRPRHAMWSILAGSVVGLTLIAALGRSGSAVALGSVAVVSQVVVLIVMMGAVRAEK